MYTTVKYCFYIASGLPLLVGIVLLLVEDIALLVGDAPLLVEYILLLKEEEPLLVGDVLLLVGNVPLLVGMYHCLWECTAACGGCTFHYITRESNDL